jgi:light-regulated signal transduction histidine kinase (bacteriophytochrome)
VSKEQRFEWLYNETMLKHYMVDNQNNIQLGYEAIVNLLNQQNKQIADLEAKLAEKEKEIENWRYMYEGVMQSCHNGIEENNRLEKLLAEKDEQINMLEEHKFYADNIIQSYADKCKNHNQDKISFAVEQLEKVKLYNRQRAYNYMPLTNYIDNQIKQLKEGK